MNASIQILDPNILTSNQSYPDYFILGLYPTVSTSASYVFDAVGTIYNQFTPVNGTIVIDGSGLFYSTGLSNAGFYGTVNSVFVYDLSGNLLASAQGLDISASSLYFSGTGGIDVYSIFAGAGLSVTPPSQTAAINLTEDTTGNITTAPQTGTIQFTDSDPKTTPTASVSGQSITATDSQGNAVNLTSVEISALEGAFTIAPAAGNTNDGEIDWTYNPDALNFLAGETAVDTATIDVTDQDGNIAAAQVAITIVGPPAVLFTTGADVVNFNALLPVQQAAIQVDPSSIYNGLGGDDVVTLPSAANFNESVGNGDTLNWSSTTPFVTNSRPGNKYTISGTDGDYDIQLGAGLDTVTITGNGSSTITGGSGTGTISINGNGNNTVTVGSSDDTIAIVGDGNNTAIVGNGGTLPA